MYIQQKLNYIEIRKGFDKDIESPLRSADSGAIVGFLYSFYLKIRHICKKFFGSPWLHIGFRMHKQIKR